MSKLAFATNIKRIAYQVLPVYYQSLNFWEFILLRFFLINVQNLKSIQAASRPRRETKLVNSSF